VTLSSDNVMTPKSTETRNSNSSGQIQIKSKSTFDSVSRDIENSEFLDLADFGGVVFSVESVVER